MDGCSEFPDLQQAALEAGGQALDATRLASAGKQQQRKDGGAAAAASSGGPSVCGICAAKNRYKVKVLGKQAADPASMKHAQADCPNQGLPNCEGFKMIDQLFRVSSKKQ
uniref:Uncharacterized protein n=1 Tax=Chromera velia CCMP2878 TaxID=1169474 RepID=A0A0G4GKD7_9ALVE|eukprot:Cvel_22307.t1-p1 / transcript=Cvel_22307.t1 / gene=Cvel_22307 / organism=Chromera_velia_CCMP2878 / gene_product=hypothetical protein / transcript_product=hypothetical protein / location=Cvel_scaffold2179:22452-22964(-) / protein_length=109 / sequence_SO=supercontig / SO=protein_coding / is_pseudo=false